MTAKNDKLSKVPVVFVYDINKLAYFNDETIIIIINFNVEMCLKILKKYINNVANLLHFYITVLSKA
jgi:hypothetical protein